MTARHRKGWTRVMSEAPPTARILVVEDEEPIRKAIERLVLRYGYEVKSGASAEEGDSWLSALRFDVLLLDVELPKMKGIEFLSWALERDPEMAVIMLTGLDDPALAMQCLDLGARTYLVKPVDADFLRLAIRDALAVRQLLVERNDLAARP